MTTPLLTPACIVTVNTHDETPRSGFVQLDETTVYATAELEIPLIDEADVDLIDPRDGVRLSLTIESRLFDLGIRSRRVNHANKTITLTAASDEALLGEYSPLANIDLTAHAGDIRALVNAVLAIVIPGAHLEASPAPTGVITELEALVWKAGTTAWEFLQPLTGLLSLRLFCDEQRRWFLVQTSYIVPGVVVAIASNSREGDDTLSRDADNGVTGAIVRYRWTGSGGEAKEQIDAAGIAGNIDVLDRDTPYPGPGLAAARLKRLQGQGRSLTATSIATYTETPGMEARFMLPGTPDQIGRLQRVRWDLLDGYAQLGARELTEAPDTAWIFLPDGEAWDDSPVGESWTDEVVA